jgi:hypothetical protein
MIATGGGIEIGGSGEADPFSQLTAIVNERFLDATVEDIADPRFMYLLYGARKGMDHDVADFCIANTIEPLSPFRVERLRFAVPVEMIDADTPRSVLGPEGENKFELTYMAKRGGLKTLLLTPDVYDKRFLGRAKPPVTNLLGKLGMYGVVPMRKLTTPMA